MKFTRKRNVSAKFNGGQNTRRKFLTSQICRMVVITGPIRMENYYPADTVVGKS